MVQELNLLDAVTFELDVPHSEVVRFLRKATLLVMPSIASKEEIGEGRPTAIMEALYAGVPVVASRIGGIPELVKDGINGFLVESGKVDELANRILRLLLEPDTRLRFSEKALRIRDEVGWSSVHHGIGNLL
jgi:glycosyltransferase involved in cell wall biosynthesis